jgi:hypothetical protein
MRESLRTVEKGFLSLVMREICTVDKGSRKLECRLLCGFELNLIFEDDAQEIVASQEGLEATMTLEVLKFHILNLA